jgi:Mlc titration factor MtfA (ptsG expression regulator)
VAVDVSPLTSLLVELFTAIRLVSGYPSPDVLPQIHRVPVAEMQQKICGGRSCSVRAFYHPEWGVYVDEALDIQNDAFDRSILLHELVHHLQKTTGKFDSMPNVCLRRNAQELEAYEIQNRYLADRGAARRALAMGWSGQCKDEGTARLSRYRDLPPGRTGNRADRSLA